MGLQLLKDPILRPKLRDVTHVAKPVLLKINPANINEIHRRTIPTVAKYTAMMALASRLPVHDRRMFDFDQMRSPRLSSGGLAIARPTAAFPEFSENPDVEIDHSRITLPKPVRNPVSPSSRGERIRFVDPLHVIICARRHLRRRVMHAFGIAGTRVRPPTYNRYSHVRC